MNTENLSVAHVLAKTLAVIGCALILVFTCVRTARASDVDASSTEIVISYERADPGIDAASRAWYGRKLTLSRNQTFGPQTFDGNNVGIEMTASCPKSGSFTVTLYKMNPTKQRIGSATFKRNGFTKAVWENVGSGRYLFECAKSPDGATVTSNDVAIYSW